MSAMYKQADVAGHRKRTRLHVLVVEDHQDTAFFMQKSLEHHGYSVRTVGSHKESLKVASEWLPDVLVCDVGLVGKDGLEVMRTMRAAYPTLKGIVVSGRCSEEDIAKSLEAGFSAHLCKPVDDQQLVSAIRRLFEDEG